MLSRKLAAAAVSLSVVLFWETRPAHALFHLMQIEQVIGGVKGDTSAQAIQLRMRTGSQNLLASTRIRAWDAAGANPIVVVNFGASVPIATSGSRVLIASASFLNKTNPTTVANFAMSALIPPSYLAAGSLTFESDTGFVYWRLSWGGAAYTGSCASGGFDNDADGNFCPPVPGPLPTCGLLALRFTGAASAASTNNAANYALTSGPAVFINNAGTSFTLDPVLAGPGGVDFDGDVDLADFDLFGVCFAGPDLLHAGFDCLDTEPDGDIDLADFADFQVAYTGP